MEETGLAQALVYTLGTIRHVAAILHLQQSGCSAWGFPTSGSVTESDRVCAMNGFFLWEKRGPDVVYLLN